MNYLLLISMLFVPHLSSANEFMRLFKNSKPVIAAIMVERLDKNSYSKTEKWLLDQAQIATTGSMDGLLVEFRGGGILSRDIPESELEMMANLTKKVIESYPSLVVGVEILWHFPGATLKLAKRSNAAFVRIDFFSDEVIADNLNVPVDPEGIIGYKKSLQADNVALLTDIQVKYSKMVNPKIPLSTSASRAQKFGSNGVIVSGTKSGSSPDTKRIANARRGVRSIPVVIGSGFSIENAPEILPLVDAVIVGTSISEKTGGPLIPEKVSALMAFVKDFRKNKSYKKDL